MFDAELWEVADALREAGEQRLQGPITVYLDSQAAIKRIQRDEKRGVQAIVRLIHSRAKELQQGGSLVAIRWVPGHAGVEGNERADKAAKDATMGEGRRTANWASIAHI